jgi:hypothetical protein
MGMGVQINRHVEDRLYIEAENGCAICGSKDNRSLTIHHIEHDLKEPDNSYDNLIVMCHNCHTPYHQEKGITKNEIRKIKRRLIIKTLTPFGLNALKVANRKNLVVGSPFTLLHLVELGLLEKRDLISSYSNDDGNEVDLEVEYQITEKGRALYEKWAL